MADNTSTSPGIWGTMTSLGGIIFAWVTIDHVKSGLTIIASIVGICAGIFSARYYWLASKEKKQSLQNHQNGRV